MEMQFTIDQVIELINNNVLLYSNNECKSSLKYGLDSPHVYEYLKNNLKVLKWTNDINCTKFDQLYHMNIYSDVCTIVTTIAEITIFHSYCYKESLTRIVGILVGPYPVYDVNLDRIQSHISPLNNYKSTCVQGAITPSKRDEIRLLLDYSGMKYLSPFLD